MQIGIVGLGRMGAGMARRLAQAGVNVLCYDQADEARAALQGTPHVECAENLAALCGRLFHLKTRVVCRHTVMMATILRVLGSMMTISSS